MFQPYAITARRQQRACRNRHGIEADVAGARKRRCQQEGRVAIHKGLRQLRCVQAGAALHCIVLVPNRSEKEVARMMLAGASDYLLHDASEAAVVARLMNAQHLVSLQGAVRAVRLYPVENAAVQKPVTQFKMIRRDSCHGCASPADFAAQRLLNINQLRPQRADVLRGRKLLAIAQRHAAALFHTNILQPHSARSARTAAAPTPTTAATTSAQR